MWDQNCMRVECVRPKLHEGGVCETKTAWGWRMWDQNCMRGECVRPKLHEGRMCKTQYCMGMECVRPKATWGWSVWDPKLLEGGVCQTQNYWFLCPVRRACAAQNQISTVIRNNLWNTFSEKETKWLAKKAWPTGNVMVGRCMLYRVGTHQDITCLICLCVLRERKSACVVLTTCVVNSQLTALIGKAADGGGSFHRCWVKWRDKAMSGLL